MAETTKIYTQLEDIAGQAKKLGATDSRAIMRRDKSLTANILQGRPAELQHSNNIIIQLDVLIGKRQATTTIQSLRPSNINAAIQDIIDSAKLSSENPYAGLPDSSLLTTSRPDLDIFDPAMPSTQDLYDLAAAAEDAGLQDKRIKQSDGASAGRTESHLYMLHSNGFQGHYSRTQNFASVTFIAESAKGMERDSAFDVAIYHNDLRDMSQIGQLAAKRVLERLDARKVKSGQYPVIFDQRIASVLMREFAKAVSGNTIAKGMSFLKDSLGKQVLPRNVNIIDDPLMKRGLASRPFNSEGMASQRKFLVKDGVLSRYLLGTETARQMGVDIRNHIAGSSNLYITNGTETVKELMSDIKEGFLVTSLMGHGGNTLTGAFSFGASGLWIKNGKPAFAVSEVTISGDMGSMFKNMRTANNMDMRRPSAPSIRIDGMTIGGN